MKHLFKKGLSLLLAVLMVTSMLPMSTLAAAVTNGRTAGDGVYSTREDADPPEAKLPDETGEDLTDAPADITDGEEVVDDVEPVDEEPADAAAADAEDDLRVELPADMEMTAEPTDNAAAADGEGDLRVELPADMEFVDEGLTADPTYVAGADAEGDLRPELPAGEDQNGDRPEKPDIGEEPDEPAKPLWDDLEISLSFVVEEGKMMYVVDITGDHGDASSGTWGLAIVPSLAKNADYMTVGDAVADGTIFPPASAVALQNAIRDNTGLESGKHFIMSSGSAFQFSSDGSYQLKGEMPAFNDLLKALKDPDAGIEDAAFLDPLTGIPFTAVFWSQEDPNGLNLGEGAYHPAGHIRDEVYTLDLRDPDNITFDGGSADVDVLLTNTGMVSIKLTNDGHDEVTVGATDFFSVIGEEYFVSNGEGAKISASETSDGIITVGLSEDALAAGGTIVLTVPYTFGDEDKPTNSAASITIKVLVDGFFDVGAKPVVFVMTEGDTMEQFKTVQITTESTGVYVYGGLEPGGEIAFIGMNYPANLALSGGGDPYTAKGEEDATFDEAALIFGEGYGKSAPVRVTFKPAAEPEEGEEPAEWLANEDGSYGIYNDQITIDVINEDEVSAVLTIPIQIIVKPKLRTQYTLSYDVNGNTDATAPSSSSMYPDADPDAGEETFVTVAGGLGDDVGGKKFLGWNEDPKAKAGDPNYTPGKEIVLDHNTTLYAIWETNLVTITYHRNYNASDTTVSTRTGEPGKLISNGTLVGTDPSTWTRTGYSPAGWYTDQACNSVFSGTTFDTNRDIYLKWTPDDIDITYAKGSCAGATFVTNGSKQTVKYDQTDAVVRTAAEVFASIPTGWNFVNWKVSDSKSYAESATFDKITEALTLTAQWTIDIQFDVTSECPSGATGTLAAPATQKITPGGTLTDASKLAAPGTLTGYSFGGWYPRLDNGSLGGTAAAAGTTYNNPTTLVAKWTINKYTLTYDTNGHGSVGATKGSINHGTVETLVDPAANKKTVTESNIHWVWQGWAAADDSTTKITQVTMDDNKTVYAIWAQDSHTVSYDGNSGTLDSSHTSSTITCGDPYTVSSVEPTRSGYNFTGWNTADDGSGTPYAKGAKIDAVTDDITLYAQWSATTNTVKYTDPASSGAKMPANATITAGAVTLSAPTSVPTGWTFVEWMVQGGTTTYTGTQALTGIVGDLTLEAQWKVDVTYVSTYGTAPSNLTGATAVPYNTDITVGAITAKTGDTFASDIYTDKSGTSPVSYRFNGWTASPAANISKTTVGATDATVTGPVTLTAGWVGQSSVKFDLNGGTLATGKTVPGDQSGDVSTAIPNKPTATATTDVTKAGYTFGGWAKNKNNGTASDAVTVANIQFPTTAGTTDTYYAIWTINTYTVTFKRNHSASDTTTHDTKTTNYNTPLGSSNYPANPSRTGYTFGGWYPNQDGTGTAFTNATVVTGDTTVYAKWTVNPHTVTYDKNNGPADAVVPGVVNTTYGATVTVGKATTATAGWTFKGWSRSNGNQTVSDAEASTITMADADITLYAQWTVDVTFYSNVPTGETAITDPGTKTTQPGGTLAAANYNAPGTLTNYTFKGWFDTNAATGGTEYKAASTYPAPTKLYARWTPKTYIVSFVDNDETIGNPSAVTDVYGTEFALPSAGSKTGYTTTGWYDKNEADAATATKQGDAGDTYTITKTETLYAHWSPVDVTVTYNNNGVGTGKPADANATYDGTYTAADATNTTTGITGGTWSTMADGKKMFTETATGKRYRFDGWEVVGTATTLLGAGNNGAAAIAKVNTASGVVKTTADGKDTYTLTLKAKWTQLFTITYAAGAHGTITTAAQPTSQINVVAGKYNTAYPSSGTPKAEITGGTWETANGIFTIGNEHWLFNGWSDGKNTYTANQQIDISSDVTLTAQWATRYKITLAPATRPSTTITDNIVSVKVGSGTTLTSTNATTNYTYVPGSFALSGLTKADNPNDYIFVKWTATKTVGGGATTGTFTNGAAGTANVTTDDGDTFDPQEDTTLTPTFALKPKMTPAVDGYQLNFGTSANVAPAKWQPAVTPITKPTNTLPTYTWTAGDATIGDVTITAPAGVTLPGDTTAGGTATLTPGTEYTYNATTGDIQFQRAYLLSLEATQKYTVTVKSTTNGEDTKQTADLWAVVTPDDLINVVIGVKPDQAADYEASPVQNATLEANRTKSASVTDTNRDVVKYLDHEEITIIPGNLLTYQWYYADAPVEDGKRGPAETLAGLPALPTGATKIGTSTTNNNVDMDNDVYKGKYIFATVVATGTGKNAVVTNSIPVDYDAAVKVTKDGNLVDNATDAQGYKVYLVKKGVTPALAASNDALTEVAGSVVATTYDTTNKVYKTAASTLTGGEEYTVYVNKVEDNFTKFENTNVAVTTQVNANAAKEVKFFSVNAVETDLKHAKDKSDTPQEVGESFGTDDADAPITEFYAEGVTAKFNSGKGVLTGSKVTAKASKTWTQDYDVNWGMKEDAGTTAPALTYVTDNQTATNAVGIGKNYTNIKAKTWIGAQLEQNTYDIKGDIKGTGKVASAKLTFGTYTFNGNVGNGGDGDIVTFTVPKSDMDAGGAITGKYTLSATGATSPRTTVLGYSVPSAAAATQPTPIDLAKVTAAGTDKFTIFIAASTWSLNVTDDNKKDALVAGDDAFASASQTHDTEVTASDKVKSNSATTTWTKTFANYVAGTDQLEYNVTVSNPGNTDLTVTLVVKKTVGSTTTTIYDGSATVTTDTANKVAFTDLTKDASSFNLAGKVGTTTDSKTFKVTIPNDLDNDDDVTYSFEFTSKDKNTTTIYGPTLTYNLKLVVNPIPVESVGINDNGNGTFSANALTFDAAKAPLDVASGVTLTTANDLTYQWYVGTKPTVNATTGAVTGTAATGTGNNTATYTPDTADGGKTLWLVVSGKNNASKYAMNSVAAPYSAKVTILENTNKTGDYDDYEVWLVPNSVTTQPTDWAAAGGVRATHKTGDGDGEFTTGADLANGTTYNVWTNVVKGTPGAVYKNNGALGTVTDGVASKTVTYYSVTVNETTYDNKYTDLKGTDFFGTGDDGTTAASQTGNTGITATAKAGATDVASGGWVVTGTEVTFTHDAWSKDYTLAWTGATKQDTDAAGGGSTAKTTVSANKTVDAKLTLTLYQVTGYAIGNGAAQYVTMTSSGDANANVFTTKTGAPDANAIMALPNSMSTISATTTGQTMVFSVPKGSYAVGTKEVSGTTVDGYHATHLAATLEDDITKTINSTDTFDVLLSSKGVGLVVTDDDATSAHSVGVTWSEGDPLSDSVTHTETLQFGYTTKKDIVLTLTNNSATDTEGKRQIVYQIAGTEADPDGSDVTWDSTALSSNGTTTTVATLSEDDTAPTVKLTIPTGLEAGTYTYTATFTFAAEAAGGTVGTLNYNLEIVVKPAEFSKVKMKYDDASAALDTTKVLEAGKALALYDAETTVNDVFDSLHLTADAENDIIKDYSYAWYASTDNSIKTANLSWDDTDGTVSFTDGKTATAIGTADQNLAAATIKLHQSEYIYLMIYATADNGKVIKAAISDPVRAGYQGVVQIKENGALQTAEPMTDGNAKYTVFIMDGANAIPTAWDTTAQGYVAVDGSDPIYLDPTKTYTVKVSAYEGDTTTTALTGASIKGDDLAHNSHIATAEYFTVTAVATTAKHYVDAVGETFDADNMPKAKLTIGAADVDGKTVLKGQNVAAKFDETTTDSGVAWTQDYTLTWQDKKDNSADGTSLDDTTLEDTATSAVSTGQTWSNITTKTYIGGRLDQNTYTITGSIQGSGSVASVVMTDGKDNANTTVQGGTINKDDSNKITDVDNNGTAGNAGDKITLTVVKGTYALKANAGANTTVVGITWNTDARVAGDSVSDKDVAADKTFIVHLSAASAVLKVMDTHDTDHNATSDAAAPASNYKHADHPHNVYFSAMTADETLTVKLENRGNTPLTLDTPTVWKVNAGKALADVKWSDWANANPVTAKGADGAFTEPDVIAITNLLTDDDKTLEGATTNPTTGDLENFQKVTAATITIDKKVDVADSGIYILSYTTGDNGPVVYYVLDLVVNQLPIDQVETNNSGAMVGVGETITAKGYDADDNKSLNNVMVQRSATTTDTTDAATANLTGDDVHFAWVKVDAGATAPAKANLSVVNDGTNDGTLASTVGTVVSQSESYTLQPGDQDSDFYLVAFAPNYDGNVTNATDMAIADVVKAKRTVGVKVTLDTLPVNSAADPGYVIYLVEQGKSLSVNEEEDGSITLGEGTWATTWNGTDRYQAAIDTAKTYEVYAVTYKGGATVLKAITDTLGGAVDEVTVPYFSVNFTEDLEVNNVSKGFKSYLPDGDATTNPDNQIQEALSVKVSTTKGGNAYETAPLTTSGTPVLSGMNVKVTVDATKPSNNTTDGVKKRWSEEAVQPLHTLTTMGWSDTNNKTSGITYADSIASGDIAVTEKRTFLAKLEQVRFTVKFTVQDISTDETGALSPSTETALQIVTLTPRGENATATGTKPSVTANAPGYKHGDTVTINNVPMGDYTVTATKYPGSPTLVTGYTWNDATTEDKDGDIVEVSADKTKNEDTTGNTIRMLKATKVVNWYDTFDVNTGGVLANGDFVDSNGFQKVDDTAASPKKLFGLTKGYAGSKGDVLTYTVRAMNGGNDAMKDFYLTSAGTDLDYDLTDVKRCKLEDDGTVNVLDEHLNATTPFELGGNEFLEFTVTIPEGKTGQKAYYTTKFIPHCYLETTEAEDLVTKQSYDPAYQVKTPVEFTPGEALVRYGGSAFEDHTDIAWKPFTSDEDEPNFTYKILELDGTDDAAILTEINDKLGLSLTTLDAKPSWLTADANGKITIPTGAHATGVNVKVNGTPADFAAYEDDANGHKVKGEITLYIKATDTKTDETYIIPYVVDVEPGQLQIVDGSFTYTQADAVGGQDLDKSKFTYTKVTNDDAAPLDVIAASDIAGGKNTALGNTTAKDGKVNVGDTHTATWTLDPEKYVSDVSTQHIFTVTYKPLNDAEKWNYKPDTYTETITASRPALGLTFGDVLGKSSIETDPAAELKIGRAPEDGYTEILTDGNKPYAPEAMEHKDETYRKGEYIVYLDTEPKYTVTLTATGNLHDVEVEEELPGFKVVKGDILRNVTTLADGEKKVFELELDALDANGKWVGEHRAWYKVTGTGDSGETTSATYELVFRMDPKVIAEAHVTDLTDPEPDTKPDTTVTVTAKDPEGEDIKPGTPDKHGNTPIKPTVTWTEGGKPVDPTKDFEDGKDYTVTVELPADPNYTFEDETPAEPNYTAGDEGPDDDYTVEVKEDPDPTKKNEKVTFTKTTELPKRPELQFEDVNANNESDKVEASPTAVRPTITVMKGQPLGKYFISLGAYGNDVKEVSVAERDTKLPDGTVWALEPASMDYLYKVEPDTVANKQVYTLDLTGVDTSKIALDTYKLSLLAVGKNDYDEEVTATYTVEIKVVPGAVGVLTFEDVNAANTADAVPAKVDAVRETITVKRGESLGKYTITLRDSVATTYQVSVDDATNTLPDGYTLTPVRPTAEEDMAVGSTKVFQLDLSGVETAKTALGTYTLKLKAAGKDINGGDVTATYTVTVKVEPGPTPTLMFDDVNAANTNDVTKPAVDAVRNISQSTNAKLGKYTINLGSYGGTTTGIKFTERLDNLVSVGVYGVSPDCEALPAVTLTSVDLGGGKQAFELDLSGMDTKTAGTYTLTLTAKGKDINGADVTATYTLTITLRAPGGGGGGGGTSCPTQVTYLLGLYGTTNDPTMEMVSGSKVKTVPNVTAVTGYKFLGWSLAGPTGDAEQDAKRALVDPKNVSITTDTVFYAVYQPVYAVPQPPIHKHYVIGYPNGNFGPADNIDRASVATIIARAVLPNFVEGADYGNPGGYSDVNGHWAASAIAYCSKYGVFNGYTDGTFKPNQPISRQELALVMARLNGVQTGGSVPFTDIGDAGAWAVDGIYTAYINGWVNGYTDGTFKPVNPIRRDETVKIFNAYLHRGVNAEGLENLTEYVHSGVASNNSENGTTEYMTWPDVTKDQWAYYEIIEAANDHEFAVDSTQPKGYAVPEQWTKCWIDEKWRYHDDANDGGPSAVAEALPNESGLDD